MIAVIFEVVPAEGRRDAKSGKRSRLKQYDLENAASHERLL